MRIDKVLEQCLKFSKRDIKSVIKKGQVLVNQEVVNSLSYNVDGNIDKCTVFGEEVNLPCHEYYMLNKPKGVLTANKDNCQPTIFDYLPCSNHYTFVGRLDKDTTGLVLVTDNGGLCYSLAQKKMNETKEYYVEVNGLLEDDIIHFFSEGVTFLDGKQCLPAQIQILDRNFNHSTAIVIISEGSRHHIKKMFLSYGVKVTALHRTRIAELKLDKCLALGEYRLLNKEEIVLLLDKRR